MLAANKSQVSPFSPSAFSCLCGGSRANREYGGSLVMEPRRIHRLCRDIASVLFSAIIFASLATPQAIHAQSGVQRRVPSRGKEIIEIAINGETFPTLGLPSISLPPVSNEFTVFMKPELPARRQFRLEGVDREWREGTAGMAIRARFFYENGEQSYFELEDISGETPGVEWQPRKPCFHHSESDPHRTTRCTELLARDQLGRPARRPRHTARQGRPNYPETRERAPRKRSCAHRSVASHGSPPRNRRRLASLRMEFVRTWPGF